MKIDEFLRMYPLRSPNIMWFLGAGASAASGIMTAYDMLWDFKRALYCAQKKVPLRSFPDLGDPVTKAKLQHFFDSTSNYPAEDADDEYAVFFETAYPAERDRRRFIETAVSIGTPSYGYKALATLLKCDKVRALWTTNFDKMVEDSAIPLFGSSGKMVVASLGEPNLSLEAINEGRWPVYTKLHGDYFSRRLKNTPTELQAQDATLRHSLVESCKRYGLAVIGFSGRDRSIMDALDEAIDSGRGYPSGLFWFSRTNGVTSKNVTDLIAKASAAGIDAHVIEVETFDELMADIINLVPDLPSELQDQLQRKVSRVSDAPCPQPKGGSPIIRLNAISVVSAPSVCRLVRCDIGGMREVIEAVIQSGADVVAARRSVGVIAFGSDSEMRKAFSCYKIKALDVHSVEVRRLKYDSAELGLLYDALARALQRERPVLVHRRRSGYVVSVDPSRASWQGFKKLKEATGLFRGTPTSITGAIPGTNVVWTEAVRIRLEHRLGCLWLLMEPTVWFDRQEEVSLFDKAKEFCRDRLVRRYNSDWNRLLEGWISAFVADANEAELKAFGIGDGLDAAFTLSKRTAFSRRGGLS